MFHGHPQLSKDGEGYVYWKNKQVEHFSFSNEAAEKAAADKLASTCEHLESLGLTPNTAYAVWFSDWFLPLTADCCYLDLLATLPGIYQSEDGELVFVCGKKAIAVHWKKGFGSKVVYNINTEHGSGEYSFHGLERQGFHILQAGQPPSTGLCYANGLALAEVLSKHCVPLSLLDCLEHSSNAAS